MRFLFVHQNFPGQYRHLVRRLADDPANEVCFITQPNDNTMGGVRKIVYARDTRGPVNCHLYSQELDRAIFTGASVAEVCRTLKDEGWVPELIVGHSGWGETLLIKDVFPGVPLLANFEFFYHASGADVGFDPEFVSLFNEPARLRTRNGINLLAFHGADWGHSATHWQRSLYPAELQGRISVLHEGIDTDAACPNPAAEFTLPDGRRLRYGDEVVTYVARNLEPYRGFHIFMRALPALLRRRRRAQVVIVGGDGVSYGAPPPPRSTFREMMLAELGTRLDPARVHFVGQLEYQRYLSLLQVSAAHVYLTYPFVLSWSCLEAMACGCLLIGSATPPVLEVLEDQKNGLTVDFFAHRELAQRIDQALGNAEALQPLRLAARNTVLQRYDLRRVILPAWEKLLGDLAARRTPALTTAAPAAPLRPAPVS